MWYWTWLKLAQCRPWENIVLLITGAIKRNNTNPLCLHSAGPSRSCCKSPLPTSNWPLVVFQGSAWSTVCLVLSYPELTLSDPLQAIIRLYCGGSNWPPLVSQNVAGHPWNLDAFDWSQWPQSQLTISFTTTVDTRSVSWKRHRRWFRTLRSLSFTLTAGKGHLTATTSLTLGRNYSLRNGDTMLFFFINCIKCFASRCIGNNSSCLDLL